MLKQISKKRARYLEKRGEAVCKIHNTWWWDIASKCGGMNIQGCVTGRFTAYDRPNLSNVPKSIDDEIYAKARCGKTNIFEQDYSELEAIATANRKCKHTPARKPCY